MKKRVVSLLLCLIMALSLIPTTAFASDIATQDKERKVSHIDIQMALNIPGVNNVQLDDNDMKNLNISAKQGGADVSYTWNNYKLKGSTDGQGNQQVRLNGSFPIGTQNNPVEYTITLTKTVSGVPYTLTLTASYWKGNVCPGLTTGGDPGIDVKFGEGQSSGYQVTITKKIEGIDSKDLAANQKFKFAIKDEKGAIVKELEAVTNQGVDTANATTFLKAGTYTVEETSSATYKGYEFKETKYSTENGTLTVNENGGSITVTNTYAPEKQEPEKTSIPVTKAWVDDENFTALRPGSIQVQLYTVANGGKTPVTGKTLTLNAANSWVGSFTDLNKTDGNGVEIEYTVEEVPVPGYTSAVTGDAANGFTITNTLNFDEEITNPGSLTIKKVNKEGIALPGAAFKLEKNGDDGFTPITGSTNDDGSICFDTLTVGTYTLTETQAPNDYKLGTVKTWTVKVEAGTPYAEEVRDNDGNLTGYKKVTPCTVTVEGLNAASDIYSITNEAIEKTDITVTKVWYDMDNKFGLRPDSITVQLKANGTEYGQPVTLNKDNNWAYTFTGLNMTDGNGTAIEYTVEETVASEHYRSTVAKDNNGNFTITNTLMTGKLMIQKSLMDANGYIRADKDLTFTFDVYAKDADITKDAPVLAGVTVAVKAGDDLAWTVQPVQLPVGDYIVVERGAADKSVAAPSGYTYRFNDITYSAPQAKPDVNALAAADPTAPEFASIVADRITWADVNNCYAHDPYTVTIPVTKTVTKALNSIDPGKVTFTFKAQLQLSDGTWVDLACTNNTITLTGTGTKSTEMSVTIPSEYFSVMTPVVTLRIIEVNDGLPNWKYADNACEIKATVKDGAINLEYAGPVAFTNTYSYTYTPPRPRPNPKPVPSAKTGDMGIALYALTSLLSLSGTALVIKKRKDEE